MRTQLKGSTLQNIICRLVSCLSLLAQLTRTGQDTSAEDNEAAIVYRISQGHDSVTHYEVVANFAVTCMG